MMGGGGGQEASTEDLKYLGVLARLASSGRTFHRQMAEGKKNML